MAVGSVCAVGPGEWKSNDRFVKWRKRLDREEGICSDVFGRRPDFEFPKLVGRDFEWRTVIRPLWR
jgi:hypothetical protein